MATVAGARGDAASPLQRPRALLIGGVAGLVAFVVFAFVVSRNVTHPFVQPLDDAWRALVGSDHGPETAPLPMFFQYLGEVPGAIALVILMLVLVIVRRWRSALFILAGFLGSTLVAQVAKNMVNRPRPAAGDGLFGPLFPVDHGSFPSGHAVTVGFIAVGVAALIPYARRWIWWIVAALLAVGVVWQRTLINAHWFSDTIAGLVAGSATTLILWWAFAPLLARDRRRTITKDTNAS